MTLQELAQRENELYAKVIDLYDLPQSDEANEQLQDTFSEYRTVHQEYATLSSTDIEALKRGLFIQWYALTEPSYLTGIADLDDDAQNKVIQVLHEVITAGKADTELIWMLNYYANWDWVFEELKSFKGFDNEIINDQNNQLPDRIDNEEMKKREQMVEYWISLT